MTEQPIAPYVPPTGAFLSPPDYRNVPLAAVASALPLPADYSTDISALTVWHQRKIGACVGHALAKLMQYWWHQKTGEVVAFSPRFLYAMAKKLDGLDEEGTYPSLVAKIAMQYGCATEATCSNNTEMVYEKYIYNRAGPPTEALEEAKQYKIPGYAFVACSDPQEVKRAIYEGGMFAGLLRIGEEWYTDTEGNVTWAADKINPLRAPKRIISGHEVILYGWKGDDFLNVANSWSTDWNIKGNGQLALPAYRPFIIEGIIIKNLPPAIKDEVIRLPKKPKHRFTRNLDVNTFRDSEVVWLQDCLKYEGLMPAYIPSTGNYLELTRLAVFAFQKKYNLLNPYQTLRYPGMYCHETTRAKLNEIFA